jgi:hypothetical protein
LHGVGSMTKARKAALIVICEDKQHKSFASRFLRSMGWDKHEIRIKQCSLVKGAGEQRVRELYAEELKRYRKSHVNRALVAIVDGDTFGVRERMRQFDRRCEELQIQPRQKKEKVAIIVPTRSIETWIEYLEGNTVNETVSYPKLQYESDCQPSVDRLVEYCRSTGLPESAPESLRAACDEYQERILR